MGSLTGLPVTMHGLLTSGLACLLLASCEAAPKTHTVGDIEIRDCGSKVDIRRIEFDQCEDFPCVVHHGQTATGRATMVAQAATNSLTCKVCTLYSILCTLYSVPCTLYSVLCTLYSVLCTLYSVVCSLYSVLCALCSVLCALYSVLCTLCS